MTANNSRLIWLDLEMTGLDPESDSILEIATLVTDSALEEVAEGPVLAIHHDRAILDAMDEWNTETHTATGLVERVRDSRVSMAEAERQTLDFLAAHTEWNSSPMCGNSICQDRRFMARLMPDLERYFHYRNVDVSTIKELARRWYPQVAAGLSKGGAHLALDDIRDSINELRYYRDSLFRVL